MSQHTFFTGLDIMTAIAERLPDANLSANSDDRIRNDSADIDRTGALASVNRVNLALTLLRAVIGIVFLAHGAQKLFVFGLEGVSGAFAGLGIPLASIVGPAVAIVELLGGLALIAGAFTRLAGLALAGVMLGAMLVVHLPAGFFAPDGIEFVFTLFAAALALVLTGPGRYSIDAVRARRNG
jgi:putative oxidoreductase